MSIYLKEMTDEMYLEYFKSYQNDPCLYFNMEDYHEYEYSIERVTTYIKRQRFLNRITLCIMNDDTMIGEIKLCNYIPNIEATLSISLINNTYKNKGYGTIAEKLLLDYAFQELQLKRVFADVIRTNTRSAHVLEKVGFKEISKEKERICYKIEKEEYYG